MITVTVVVMVMLCAAGIAFNVRFLLALGTEFKAQRKTQTKNTENTNNQLIKWHENGLDLSCSLYSFDNNKRS
ncbi:MAG: hypothetical protein WBE45_04565 [Terriglobales bacterium]|jgi:hypothetical protein